MQEDYVAKQFDHLYTFASHIANHKEVNQDCEQCPCC